MKSSGRFALLGVAAAALLGGCAGPYETARVPVIDKLAVARSPGVPHQVAITATGTVPSDGWSLVRLRPLHAPTHPPGVAAFELVAKAPRWRTPVTPGRRKVAATAIAALPPNTVLIYVLAGVNDEALQMPGVKVIRRGRQPVRRVPVRRVPTRQP